MTDIDNLNKLKTERENTAFLLNEILNEKNALQKAYNYETDPSRPKTPEEEALSRKKVLRNRLSLLVCLILSFCGFGVVLHLATYGILYQVEMAIISGCTIPFFFYGIVIFFFCDFKSFNELDYEHENQFKSNKKIRRKRPSPKAMAILSKIKEKTNEYQKLYNKLNELDKQIKELEE